MYILKYKDGAKPEKLSPKVKANMERCANFLVEMIEKYGKGVLEEIEEALLALTDRPKHDIIKFRGTV